MTSRSFNHCSLNLRPLRPPYLRSPSNSSLCSARQSPQERPSSSSSSTRSDSDHTPGQEKSNPFKANSPRRSRPIEIELPSRRKGSIQVTTPTPPAPLSARGDKLGGYFPFHEEHPTPTSYKAHPFEYQPNTEYRPSPASSSSTTTTPTNMPRLESPQYSPVLNMRPPPATSLSIGSVTSAASSPSSNLGKYHPSNYKNKKDLASKATSTMSVPASAPSSAHHQHSPSDVKRKVQAYQRDIMEQAALAAGVSIPDQAKPDDPRLVPLSSPGPVTPFELEESAGYLVAGLRGAATGADHHELVGRMIDQERARKGTRSPVLRSSTVRSPLRSPVVSPMR